MCVCMSICNVYDPICRHLSRVYSKSVCLKCAQNNQNRWVIFVWTKLTPNLHTLLKTSCPTHHSAQSTRLNGLNLYIVFSGQQHKRVTHLYIFSLPKDVTCSKFPKRTFSVAAICISGCGSCECKLQSLALYSTQCSGEV